MIAHKFPCGCTLEFDYIELVGVEGATFEFRIGYCEQHNTVEAYVGTDWLRFDLETLLEEEDTDDVCSRDL